MGVPFTKKMLSWPKGRRVTDGVWGKHWYDKVENSTEFLPYNPKLIDLPNELVGICKEAKEYYNFLKSHRIKPN